MIYLIIFFIIEIIQFVFFLPRKRRNAFVLFNTAFQAALCVGAIIYLNLGFYEYDIIFWPLLLFAFLNFISNYALIGHYEIDNKIIRPNRFLYILSAIYILFSVYFLFWKWGDAQALSNSGDYLEAYKEAHEDDASYHSNFFEQILVNYINYLHVPVMIYGFCCLTFRKTLWGLSLILSVFISQYMWATVYSSRTMLISLLVLLVLCTLFFYKHLNRGTQRILKYGGSGLVFAIVLVIVLISSSRFEGQELAEWIYAYFGRSIITFQDVVYSIKRYSDGSIFFSYFVENKIAPVTARDTGAHFVPEFARLYEDFGFGYVLFLIPILFIIKRIFTKKQLQFADHYLIFSYFFIIFIGNLYKTLDFIGLVMIILIYFMFRYTDVNMSTKGLKNRKQIVELD